MFLKSFIDNFIIVCRCNERTVVGSRVPVCNNARRTNDASIKATNKAGEC